MTISILTLIGTALADDRPAYILKQIAPLGAPEKWDYLQFYAPGHRLFVAHGPEMVVVDSRNGQILGEVDGLAGSHGIAIVPKVGRGYVTNGDQVTAFDLRSLERIADIFTDSGADAVVADSVGNRVLVMNGKGRSLTAIDPSHNTAIATLALDGKPEFAIVDDRGSVYVNIEDKSELVRIDTRSLKIQARWPLPQCESPHGLAMDTTARRLFVGCANAQMTVIDADNGHAVASLPIGNGSDAVVFDSTRRLIFSSNGEGTLSIIAENGPDNFTPMPTVKTAPGARTMAEDAASGRLFTITADEDRTLPQTPKHQYVLGSVKVLMYDRE